MTDLDAGDGGEAAAGEDGPADLEFVRVVVDVSRRSRAVALEEAAALASGLSRSLEAEGFTGQALGAAYVANEILRLRASP